jgi:dTDP-glucose 4,6-dehydratase
MSSLILYIYTQIGSSDEFTIIEFAEDVIKITGSNSKIVYKNLPVDDPKIRQPDIEKVKSILGWELKVNRAEGLKTTINDF